MTKERESRIGSNHVSQLALRIYDAVARRCADLLGSISYYNEGKDVLLFLLGFSSPGLSILSATFGDLLANSMVCEFTQVNSGFTSQE